MGKTKHRAKRLSAGHYEYRGFKVICVGYYPPEQKVAWEAVDENGGWICPLIFAKKHKEVDRHRNRRV